MMKKLISLKRRIFFYLIGATSITIALIGTFWIDSKINSYHKEISNLKVAYSSSKRLEIKNKILRLKDYIEWTQANPVPPLCQLLSDNLSRLQMQINPVHSHADKNEVNIDSVRQSIKRAGIPVLILDKSGDIKYSYNPFSVTDSISQYLHEDKILQEILSTNKKNGLLISHNQISRNNITIPQTIACYRKDILPEYTFVEIIDSGNIEYLLQLYVLDSISKLRFDTNEYVFINSIDGKALVSNGKYNQTPIDILRSGNTQWIQIFNIQKTSARHPGGVFYTYPWQKLTDSISSLKTSFFSYMPNWKWIIGTGFYEDEINSVIDLHRKELNHELRSGILSVLSYMLITYIICYILVEYLSKRLWKNIEVFQSFFDQSSKDNILIDNSQVSYQEFVDLAESANKMVELRIKAENEYKRSEEKFLLAFKNSPDAIIITAFDGRVIESNETASRVTGYSREDILNGSVVEKKLWSKPEQRDHYIQLLNRDGRVSNMEAEFRMESGEIRHGLISGEIININEDRCILSVIRDISDFLEMEQELYRLEHRFRETLENVDLISVLLDLDGNITFCNDYLLGITGYRREELIGSNWFETFVDKIRPDVRSMLLKRIKEGTIPPTFENQILTKDGTELIIHFSNTLLKDSKGRVIGATSIGEDITERRSMEVMLRESESQLSAIFNTISDILYLVSVSPSQDFIFVAINEMFTKATGLKKEDIINKNITEVIPPTAWELVIGKYKEAINTRQSVSWEEESEYPSGIKYGLVKVTPIFDSAGVCTSLVGSVHDITEIRETENQMRHMNALLEERVRERTNQLETINKELESFSYSISHDLRAPLRAILGFSQILSTRHKGSLDQEGQKYMNYIVEASTRMEMLINDLLNYSRLGRKAITLHPVELKSIVEQVYQDNEHLLDEIKAKFVIKTELPQIQGDETLLMQIFTNLIGNAIKYRRKEIETVITISSKSDNNTHEIRISDNGIGIGKEYWDKIFNVFQRLHSEDQYPGTGIGLATVKKTVTLLGGSVSVESVVGEGSDFILRFPNKQ